MSERTPQDVLREIRERDAEWTDVGDPGTSDIRPLHLNRHEGATHVASSCLADAVRDRRYLLDEAIAEAPDSPPVTEMLAAEAAMRAAFEREVHTPHAILHRLREMGYDVVSAPDTFSEKPGLDVTSWNAALKAATRAVEPLALIDTSSGYTISRAAVLDRIAGLRRLGSTDSEGR